MKKYQLIYGTNKKKEWDRIVEIFEDCNVEYESVIRVHAFRTQMNEPVVWEFYQLVSYVTLEEQAMIRPRRDRLKKIFG